MTEEITATPFVETPKKITRAFDLYCSSGLPFPNRNADITLNQVEQDAYIITFGDVVDHEEIAFKYSTDQMLQLIEGMLITIRNNKFGTRKQEVEDAIVAQYKFYQSIMKRTQGMDLKPQRYELDGIIIEDDPYGYEVMIDSVRVPRKDLFRAVRNLAEASEVKYPI